MQEAFRLKGRDDLLADLLGVSVADVVAARGGDKALRRTMADAAAEVLGVEPHELVREGGEDRSGAVLLRSFADPAHETAFKEIVAQGVHRELGRFVRVLRRKAWLRQTLGETHPTLPEALVKFARPTPPRGSRPPYAADELAQMVRDLLCLGTDPIERMDELVRDRLQIEVRTTRTLWPLIEGASYARGVARGILVNLRESPSPLRLRMVLAHELCHVLFDGGAFDGKPRRGILIFSPERREESQLRRRARGFVHTPSTFRLLEKRANAFASYLLAPPDGVRALFGRHEPPMTLSSVDLLADHFGVSRLTATNVLTNVYDWPDDDRQYVLDLIESAPSKSPGRWHADGLADVPPVDDDFRALVLRAAAAGRLFPATRDRWLGASTLTKAIPPPGDHPPGYWLGSNEAAVAAELRELLSGGDSDAALRILWDSIRDWVGAREFARVEGLMRLLSPASTEQRVFVSLLLLTRDVKELVGPRAAYLEQARAALARRGMDDEEIQVTLGRFV